MKRFHCLEALAPLVGERLVITNVGPTRSEWELLHPSDGNLYQAQLGTLSGLALGLAVALERAGSDLGVVALEGDGSLVFSPGVLATCAIAAPRGLSIFVFDNGCYESTGGHASITARGTDLAQVARGFGLESTVTVDTVEAFSVAAQDALTRPGPRLVVARVEPSSGRGEFLGNRPPSTMDGIENKYRFARYVEARAGVRVLSPPDYATGFSPSAGRN